MSERKKIVLSLLGLSVYDTTSYYKNNTMLSLKEGEFINSIEALLESFGDEKFIFFGTKESIEKHKDKFKVLIEKNNHVEFKEYINGDLNDIFIQIMNTLIKYQEEDIIFDITHSFRDSVIMSVISTMVSQIIYRPTISMIYAKELPKKGEEKQYQYTLVGDEFLNTANIATILSTFLSTFKVPPLNSKYKLYNILHSFSTHLVSNQFKDIYEHDIVDLKDFIHTKEEELFFVRPLLSELKTMIDDIEKVKLKRTSEQFIFFSKLFVEKDYFLHASTYLIEAISYYIGEVFFDLNYIDFEIDKYENQSKLVALLKLNYKEKDFNFPNQYFVDINIETFNKFYNLREKVAEIRHNLAHINIEQDYGNIKEKLEHSIEEFKSLLDERILYKLDKTEDKKKYTVKYKLKLLQEDANILNKQKSSFAKVDTIFDKYDKEKLSDLTLYDIEKLKNFCKNNISIYQKLAKAKQERELFFYLDIDNQATDRMQMEEKVMPNGEIRKVKKLRKKPLIQTQNDKKLLKEGASRLSDVFNNR